MLQRIQLGLPWVQYPAWPPAVRVRLRRVLACDLAPSGGQDRPHINPSRSSTASHELWQQPGPPRGGTRGTTCPRVGSSARAQSPERAEV